MENETRRNPARMVGPHEVLIEEETPGARALETVNGDLSNQEYTLYHLPAHIEAGSVRPSLAVIIPALEEGHTISNVISKLSVVNPEAEIVVVDGGSLDGTAEKAQRANVHVIFESRRGYGRAIRSGIESIDADFYAIVDADDTYDLKVLPKMLDLAARGKLVIGRRNGVDKGSMLLSHIIGNKVLSLVYRVLYRRRVADTQSGFKVFPMSIARVLQEDGMTLSSEILVAGRRMRYDVAEVPVGYHVRHNGSKSKFGFWKDGIPVLLYLISTRLRKRSPND